MTDGFINEMAEWCKTHSIDLGTIPSMYENGLVENRKTVIDKIAERVFIKASYMLFQDFAHTFEVRYTLRLELF